MDGIPERALDVAAWRRDYLSGELVEAECDPDAIAQFRRWLADAVACGVPEPNAMVLATADAQGVPSARTVLLKGIDHRGFAFYTNRTSRKGRELAVNPHAALVFTWVAIQRQVVVTGPVGAVDDEEADIYFAARPHASQLGAWASRQSTVVAGRPTIDAWERDAYARFGSGSVPRPDFWVGYRVEPQTVELWQGRASRLHDRIRYRREGPGGPWRMERIAP